jgi:carboxylesterase type B
MGRDNIAQFGGNPSRMIHFEQSAGAASVDFYAYAWHKDTIVSGFIMESGSAALVVHWLSTMQKHGTMQLNHLDAE